MWVRYPITAILLGVCTTTVGFAAEAQDFAAKLQYQQPGVQLTLMAEHPDVVTPTGIDVDDRGRVWVVASHTHFRPKDYDGPEHDEVLVFSPEGERHLFYAQTDATMDLECGADGWVYLAERDRILRVRDSDGDFLGDQEETIAVLDSEADYPHNGLCGLAWDPNGDLIFALGQNHSQPWRLRGTDGSRVRGTGEGGVFRCRADGTNLRRIATGFWNPFGICVRSDGTLFAAENDPGERPPCRLLHVVEGGDYGYQRRYGNEPFHPFVCWNGELRGTLPMVHPIGEAPCGIAPLGDGVIVPSWTEHRIDFYPLRPRGASFAAERIVLVEGSDHFRPTCITQASPTVFYLADWVEGSYALHGRGRIWRLEIDADQADWLESIKLAAPNEAARQAERLRRGTGDESDQQLFALAGSSDAFIARAAIDAIATRADSYSPETVRNLATDDRIALLLAIRKAEPQNRAWVRQFWDDESAEIQFETLRWIADEDLVEFLPMVEVKLRTTGEDHRLFEACLATWNTLQGNPRAGVADPSVLITHLRDESTSPRTRAFALRLVDPNHPKLTDSLLDQLIASGNAQLITEATRTLVNRGTTEARRRLLEIAKAERYGIATRADAVAGLANPAARLVPELLQLADHDQRAIREEALRALRFAELSDSARQQLQALAARHPASGDLVEAALRPSSLAAGRPEPADVAAWQERLLAVDPPVDRAAGRRIFHHASVGACANCHRHQGRGNVVGPDLSAASSLGQDDRLLTALLQPSRDVDPQYYPRALVTEDGSTFTGILLRDGGEGKEFYRDNRGRERRFLTSEIVMRRELTVSMMPDGLTDTMTDREIRDLLAFLDSSGS